MFIPNDEYFDKLNKLRPSMEQFNQRIVSYFEIFLRNPVVSNIIPIIELEKNPISISSQNVYSHVFFIHILVDILFNELNAGLHLFTTGVDNHITAIDKYHKTVFMTRRHAILTDPSSTILIEEAKEYILSEQISPVALSYIIKHEPCGDIDKAFNYWCDVLQTVGSVRNALLLQKLKDYNIGE